MSKYQNRPFITQYLRRYLFSCLTLGASKFGDGVVLYLRKDLDFNNHPDCTFSDLDIIESTLVEIIVPCGKNIIAGTISLFLYKFNIKIPYYSFENLYENFRLV